MYFNNMQFEKLIEAITDLGGNSVFSTIIEWANVGAAILLAVITYMTFKQNKIIIEIQNKQKSIQDKQLKLEKEICLERTFEKKIAELKTAYKDDNLFNTILWQAERNFANDFTHKASAVDDLLDERFFDSLMNFVNNAYYILSKYLTTKDESNKNIHEIPKIFCELHECFCEWKNNGGISDQEIKAKIREMRMAISNVATTAADLIVEYEAKIEKLYQ